MNVSVAVTSVAPVAALATILAAATPPPVTTVPVPSRESRAAAAGWITGTWHEQHQAINRIGDEGRLDLVFIGDSITQGWGGRGRNVAAPAALVWHELFRDAFGANFGISGDRTQHLLWRIANGNFDGVTPRHVVLMIGTNNLAHDTPEDIAAGIEAVVDALGARCPHATILLCTIVRGAGPDDPLRVKAAQTNRLIGPLARRANVRLIDMERRFYLADGRADTTLMRGDFVHFAEDGYRVWGRAVLDAMSDDLHLTVLPLPAETRGALDDHGARAHVLADPEWHTWGGSVVAGADGRFHMFYARWPRAKGFPAWLTHSEVAHAVADRPQGPYAYLGTALRGRGVEAWDRTTAHNPKIKRFDDRFYLYYIGTSPAADDDRPLLRAAQRTGVAIGDSLDGPWRRLDAPIVEPAGPITTLTVNPAVTRGPDGVYYMIVKGDKPGTAKFIRNQAVATSTTPDGPFRVAPRPAIDTFDSEDASIWYDDARQRFYAVYHAHDHIGLMTSADGTTWDPARHPLVMNKRIEFTDGTSIVPDRHERPFVLTDEVGRPLLLLVAAKVGDRTYNFHLELRATPCEPASSRP